MAFNPGENEITEKEKREISEKVFPLLKKRKRRNTLFRLLRFSRGILAAALVISCVNEPVSVKSQAKPADNAMVIRNGMAKAEDPKEFELNMPQTEIGLASVYKYSKEPTVVKIADGILDFDYDNGKLVLLKNDRLETNSTGCLSITLTKNYTSVLLSGDYGLLNGKSGAAIADIRRCGIIKELNTDKKGVSLSGAGFLEFSSDGYRLFDRTAVAEKAKGSFSGGVIYGGFYKENMVFATKSGKIALIDLKNNRFSAINAENIGIKDVSTTEDGIYIYSDENKLIKLERNGEQLIKTAETQGKEGCFLLKKSGYMYCGGYITGTEKAMKSPVEADSGLFFQNLLFLKKEGVLNFVDTEKVYKRSLAFGVNPEIKMCLSGGKAYFYDLDQSVKSVNAEGREEKEEKYPESCDHVFELKAGMLKASDGRTIYKFAENITQSPSAIMLRRIIGQDIYYYFEKR